MMFENIDRVGMFPGIDSVYLIADPAMRSIITLGASSIAVWLGASLHQALSAANAAVNAFSFVPR